MDLYKLHSKPKTLAGYKQSVNVPTVAWNKFESAYPKVTHEDTEFYKSIFIKDAKYASLYAINIMKERWPEAEQYIMKSPKWVLEYMAEVMPDEEWPAAEKYIKQSPQYAYEYAYYHLGERWPEAEDTIMKSPSYAFEYANDIIKGRWPEAEKYIMKNPEAAYFYAIRIIKGRWPEAEKYIKQNSKWWSKYNSELEIL